MRLIWGKVIGGVVGLILYGPAGLVLGLVLGQVFDNGLRNVMYPPAHTQQVRALFFKTTFETIGYLAKADGRVSEREIQVVRDIMLHDFRLNHAQMRIAIQYFNTGKSPIFNITNGLSRFQSICANYPDLRRFFLELMVKATVADGTLTKNELQRLELICNTLGIVRSELDYQLGIYGYNFKQQHAYEQHSYSQQGNAQTNNAKYNYNKSKTPQDELAAAYRLLGVNTADNVKVIKLAYRKLISQYHPDKLISKGLPTEMMEIAKQKAQQITAAYDLIMRSRQ